MTISTSGRKVTLSQSFIDAIDKRMTKFDKYFENDAQATVTISAEGNRLTAEVTVRYRGFIYRAEKTETDML
ncbi:MAG: HPF/RaiA family ribosome-associated protein, partial [Oscillospiraceae bacterium]|nr:HPF/RaiA family ribosome-associated protein [Oscillospiraceae bacterium]